MFNQQDEHFEQWHHIKKIIECETCGGPRHDDDNVLHECSSHIMSILKLLVGADVVIEANKKIHKKFKQSEREENENKNNSKKDKRSTPLEFYQQQTSVIDSLV